jgi:prephenate dehydrogenase
MTLNNLSPKQQEAVHALIGGTKARTYQEAADLMGIHLGTLYTYLRRIKEQHPEIYSAVMQVRKDQLAERHIQAQKRARKHTDKWFRRKRSRDYYYKHGYWPWERGFWG